MSEVYQHAICNIAATGALDSTKGLFFNKNLFASRPCKVSIPVRGSPAAFKNVYIVDHEFWEYRIERAPLIRRAWVVQERLLARRVLHFNRDQLYWECRERSACEVFPRAMPESMMPLGFFKDIVPNTELRGAVWKRWKPSNYGDAENSLETIRSKVLSSYSRAELSNPEDKEAALSGILSMLEGIFDDTYIAGLWRKGLPTQLLWRASEFAAPSPAYRAPSWSWLSMDGEVNAYRTPLIEERDRDTFLEITTAEFEAIKISRAGESALSPIETGFMNVRGTLVHVRWKDTHRDHRVIPLVIDGQEGLHVYADFDCASFSIDSTGWIMQILAYQVSGDLYGDGLVLQLNPDGRFRRVGIFSSAKTGTWRLLSRRHQAILTGEKFEMEKIPERGLEGSLSGVSISEVADHLKEEQIPPLCQQEAVKDQSAHLGDQNSDQDNEERTIIII